jgi:hypothetical protein
MQRLHSEAKVVDIFTELLEPFKKVCKLESSLKETVAKILDEEKPTATSVFSVDNFLNFAIVEKEASMDNVWICEQIDSAKTHFVVEVPASKFKYSEHRKYENDLITLRCYRVLRGRKTVRVVFDKLPSLLAELRKANSDKNYTRVYELVKRAIKTLQLAEGSSSINQEVYNELSLLVDEADNVVVFNYCYIDFAVQHGIRYEKALCTQDEGKEKLYFLGKTIEESQQGVEATLEESQNRSNRSTTDHILYDALLNRLWSLEAVANGLDFFKSPDRIKLLGALAYCTKNEPTYSTCYQVFINSPTIAVKPNASKTKLEATFKYNGRARNDNELALYMLKNMEHHCIDHNTLTTASTDIGKPNATVGDVTGRYLENHPTVPTSLAMAYAEFLHIHK